MHELTDSTSLLENGEALRRRLNESSYLFFRGMLNPDAVLGVRRDVVAVLERLGWIVEGTDPMEARPSDRAAGEGLGDGSGAGEEYFRAYVEIQKLQSFHELGHDPRLVSLVETVIGEEVLVHPRKIFRVVPPDPAHQTGVHRDHALLGGTADVLTCWVPIGDCPAEVGGIRVLEDSHRAVLESGRTEPLREIPKLIDSDDPRWAATDYRAGDVLVFHSLTAHGARPNVSGRMRLSADYRHQAKSLPVSDASLCPHYYPAVPAWEVLTSGWTSTRSAEVPEGLTVVPMWDPFQPIEVIESRLLTA